MKSPIEEAIRHELDVAKSKHGETFHSVHEAYAVLLEEIQETDEEMQRVKEYADAAWLRVRTDGPPEIWVERMQKHAKQMAMEAAQVAAVCRKWMEWRRDG